ncbi:hypothetical protein C8Q72DRAFT_892571, partial [Fomitopsis betulina]
MASSSAAFLRAMSPMAASMAPLQGVMPVHSDEERMLASRLHRQSLLGAANSVDDVIALVPRDYRDDLRPLLLEAAAKQTKICNAERAHTQLVAHKGRGTLPQHLRSKVPALQLAKEYASDEQGAAYRA